MAQITAEIFSTFLYGAAGVIGGGLLFEGGKRYAKTAGSNQFKGKIEALPFFTAVIMLGWILQRVDTIIDSIVFSFPPLTRLGMIVLGSMALFNHSVDYFTYTDPKSVSVYAIGLVLIVLPLI